MKDTTIEGYTYFDDRCFPIPDKKYRDLAWRLRYAQDSITKNEMFYLASVLNSYDYIMHNTNKDNAHVVKKVRESLSMLVQQPLSGSQGSPKSKCKRCGCEIEPTKLELCYSCYESEE